MNLINHKSVPKELWVKPELEAFWKWWSQSRPYAPPFEGSIKAGGTYGDGSLRQSYSMVLYRSEIFQVEQLIYPAGAEVPEHRHPEVESIGVYLSGDIGFTLVGLPVHTWEQSVETATGHSSSFGWVIPIPATAMHSIKIGPKGGCFLSFQQWLNDTKVQRVSDNWEASNAIA